MSKKRPRLKTSIRQPDLVVYATPLYHFTVNAALKVYIERTLPVLQPFFEEREGHTQHPLRAKTPAVVMAPSLIVREGYEAMMQVRCRLLQAVGARRIHGPIELAIWQTALPTS
jgi:FMN-dependent NADH-azoreductase